jgi:hypothetical protein
MSFFKSRRILILVGSILLLVLGGFFVVSHGVTLAGFNTSFASATTTPTTNKYCQTYLDSLASQLNISADKLKQANQNALKAVIEQAVTDGKLTREQADKMEQNLVNSNGPCMGIGKFAGGFGHYGANLKSVQDAVQKAVAAKLGISVTDLQTSLKDGTTITDLASKHNVSTSTLNSTILSAAKSELTTEVNNKSITQTQSDETYNMISTAINKGEYGSVGLGKFGGPQGFGPHGGRHGGQPIPTPTSS